MAMVEVTEQWLYDNFLSKIKVDIYAPKGDKWQYLYTRNYRYQDPRNEYCRKLSFGKYLIDYYTLYNCHGQSYKLANYPNSTKAEITYLVVLLEDSTDMDFADATFALTAQKDTVSGKLMVFVDALLCKGAFRKDFYFNDFLMVIYTPPAKEFICAPGYPYIIDPACYFQFYCTFTPEDVAEWIPCSCPQE